MPRWGWGEATGKKKRGAACAPTLQSLQNPEAFAEDPLKDLHALKKGRMQNMHDVEDVGNCGRPRQAAEGGGRCMQLQKLEKARTLMKAPDGLGRVSHMYDGDNPGGARILDLA
eukprot:gene16408-biopygen4612